MDLKYCVIFDLDGIFVDIVFDFYWVFSYILDCEKIVVLDLEMVCFFVGYGVCYFIVKLY